MQKQLLLLASTPETWTELWKGTAWPRTYIFKDI